MAPTPPFLTHFHPLPATKADRRGNRRRDRLRLDPLLKVVGEGKLEVLVGLRDEPPRVGLRGT